MPAGGSVRRLFAGAIGLGFLMTACSPEGQSLLIPPYSSQPASAPSYVMSIWLDANTCRVCVGPYWSDGPYCAPRTNSRQMEMSAHARSSHHRSSHRRSTSGLIGRLWHRTSSDSNRARTNTHRHSPSAAAHPWKPLQRSPGPGHRSARLDNTALRRPGSLPMRFHRRGIPGQRRASLLPSWPAARHAALDGRGRP